MSEEQVTYLEERDKRLADAKLRVMESIEHLTIPERLMVFNQCSAKLIKRLLDKESKEANQLTKSTEK